MKERKAEETKSAEAQGAEAVKKAVDQPKGKFPMIGVIIGIALLAVAAVIIVAVSRKEAYRVIQVANYAGDVTYVRNEEQREVFQDMNLISKDVVTTGSGSNMELLLDSDKHVAAEGDTCFSIEATGNIHPASAGIYNLSILTDTSCGI